MHHISAYNHNWPLGVRYLCRESIAETTYFLIIFCLRLFLALHQQVTSASSGCAITPVQKLLFSTLCCLFHQMLNLFIKHPFGRDSETILNEGRLLGRAFHRTVYGYGRNLQASIRLRTVHLRPYFVLRGPSYGTVRYRIRPYTSVRQICSNKLELIVFI